MRDISFEGFDGREEKLRKIIRFDMERRQPMFYRTNDLLHSERVYFLLKNILSFIIYVYGSGFNSEKALILALIHDDAEIVSGDFPVYHKDRMSDEELGKLYREEARAIEEIVRHWPENINGFNYRELLYDFLHKRTLEAQIVSFLDKIDGYCESLHEVYAGNRKFTGVAASYAKKIQRFPEEFPELEKVIPSEHPLLHLPTGLKKSDMMGIASKSSFHNIDSVLGNTGFTHYDEWKKITIHYYGINILLDVKEYC